MYFQGGGCLPSRICYSPMITGDILVYGLYLLC